jgi:hypothetical protein
VRRAGAVRLALEWRDIDREERVVYVRRSYTRGELELPKTEGSLRAVPLQARAIDALNRLPEHDSPLVFPGERGSYPDLHHFRPYQWRRRLKPRPREGRLVGWELLVFAERPVGGAGAPERPPNGSRFLLRRVKLLSWPLPPLDYES